MSTPNDVNEYRAALARLTRRENPTDAELASLRSAAESARAAAETAKQREAEMQAEVEKARAATMPQPGLAEAAAAIRAAEIEARVRGLSIAKDQAKRAAEARSAVTAAELLRQESEAVLPALLSMLDGIKAEARRARDLATSTAVQFGSALIRRIAEEEYLPRLAELLAVEDRIRAVAGEWSCHPVYELSFSLSAGDPWTLAQMKRVAEAERRVKAAKQQAEAVDSGRAAMTSEALDSRASAAREVA